MPVHRVDLTRSADVLLSLPLLRGRRTRLACRVAVCLLLCQTPLVTRPCGARARDVPGVDALQYLRQCKRPVASDRVADEENVLAVQASFEHIHWHPAMLVVAAG